jgi:predicted DsbA family dithiol-disulfide isomerase
METVSIDVVSDVVCPWCYIGQKRLARAISGLEGEVGVEVSWRPFQLDATIPAGGMDRKAYLVAKFGSEDRVREIHERIESLGVAEGIDFDFDAMKIAPNTLDAHRVIRWAGSVGIDVQDRLVRRLFALNFEEGQDVGNFDVLVEAARQAGLETALVESLLPTDVDVDNVRGEIEIAQRMGVTGVPCFLIEERYAVMGAQESAVLANAIREVAALKARGELGSEF